MEPLPHAVGAYVAAARVCRIATVRPNGEPHVIPVCPVFDGRIVYIDIGVQSVIASGVRHDDRVTVLIDDYDDDWSKLRKVILRCRARIVDGGEQATAWDLIRAKFPQHATLDWKPRLTLGLHVESWTSEGVG